MVAYFKPTRRNMRERKNNNLGHPDHPPPKKLVNRSIQFSLSQAKADPSIAWARFLTNITKVRHFKRKINFSESIQGEYNSDRHLMEQRMVNSYDKKILYLKMFFIFILTTMILLIIVSKKES